MNYDVFNGDADGICALIQLRLAKPKQSTLITGVKRDIKLLDKIDAIRGDKVIVLDISMKKNQQQLDIFLQREVNVFYADHHLAGDIPDSPNLTAFIDTHTNICTSLIINKYLNNLYPLWAITAAYGDNLFDSAKDLAIKNKLDSAVQNQLQKLGTYINYNGYGSCLEDLHFSPKELYLQMINYSSPLDFLSDNKAVYNKLEQGYLDDFEKVTTIKAEYSKQNTAVFILPDKGWAKRISGVFGNQLANQYPDKAHAVISLTSSNDYQVSVRAPLNNKSKADELCSSFPSGGGRKAAAGINHLPKEKLELFIQKFEKTYA
ncbi:MAG: DHH family phosphoesterase [Pseudomonadota bacterium]